MPTLAARSVAPSLELSSFVTWRRKPEPSFPLQLMRPPASSVLNYSPFEVLSVPTNLVD